MKKYIFPLFLILLGCSNTSIVSSWKAPDASATPDTFKKVMIAIFVKDESTRRYAEDRMSKKNTAFYPSHPYFTSRELMDDTDYCQKRMVDEGFDAIITMQLVNVEESANYVPGSYSGGYWGYHGMAYPGYYTPGYYSVDHKYVISTNVFSLKEDKLLWSGVTSTLNPTSIDQTIEEISAKVKQQMIADKYLQP
jgi:hypothetical protein